MPNLKSSKKDILSSSSIIGGASLITILIGVAKVKVIAELLGPEGIGLYGILYTFMTVGTILFGVGITTSGVRQVSLYLNKKNDLYDLRYSLNISSICLAIIAVITVLFFSEKISFYFFKTTEYVYWINFISLGIAFSLIGNAQTVWLQGNRQIKDLALIKIFSAIASATIIIPLILWKGIEVLPLAIISLPIATALISLLYTNVFRLEYLKFFQIERFKYHVKSLVTLGFALMLTGILTNLSQLFVRYILIDEVGPIELGYFQASWIISMTYIGFLVSAMSSDFYPNLMQKIESKKVSNFFVNEQIEIALILVSPLLIGVVSFAPELIFILYSTEFEGSIEILRWQILGDIFKVVAFPLGFILLAKGKSKLFFLTVLLWNLIYVSLVYFGAPELGIKVTGYAFFITYLMFFVLLLFLVKSINSLQISMKNKVMISSLFLGILSIIIMSYFSELLVKIFGILLILVFSYIALKTIKQLGINLPRYKIFK